MSAGDVWVNCSDRQLTIDQLLKLVIVEDAAGKPAVRIYPTSGGGGGGSFPDPVERVTSFTIETGAGSISAGAKAVSIANNGASDGLLLGNVLPSGVSIPFSAGMYDTLNEIDYDATGTTFLITVIV